MTQMEPFEKWMDRVEKLGLKAGLIDPPDVQFLCPGSKLRRFYRGTDGAFYLLWQSGCPAEKAIGEALVMEAW